MKINLITAQQLAARLASASPINPIFTECLHQLREMSAKIQNYCDDEGNPAHDSFSSYLINFENNMNEVAYQLSELAKIDFMERQYYSEPKQEREVCNA